MFTLVRFSLSQFLPKETLNGALKITQRASRSSAPLPVRASNVCFTVYVLTLRPRAACTCTHIAVHVANSRMGESILSMLRSAIFFFVPVPFCKSLQFFCVSLYPFMWPLHSYSSNILKKSSTLRGIGERKVGIVDVLDFPPLFFVREHRREQLCFGLVY